MHAAPHRRINLRTKCPPAPPLRAEGNELFSDLLPVIFVKFFFLPGGLHRTLGKFKNQRELLEIGRIFHLLLSQIFDLCPKVGALDGFPSP